jgi:hypothetical protein
MPLHTCLYSSLLIPLRSDRHDDDLPGEIARVQSMATIHWKLHVLRAI